MQGEEAYTRSFVPATLRILRLSLAFIPIVFHDFLKSNSDAIIGLGRKVVVGGGPYYELSKRVAPFRSDLSHFWSLVLCHLQ